MDRPLYPKDKSEQARLKELQLARDLLALQQEENEKMERYVTVLNEELQDMHSLLDSTQLKVNILEKDLVRKEKEIEALQHKLNETMIDTKALKEMGDFNCKLYDKIKQLQIANDKLTIELEIQHNLNTDESIHRDKNVMKMAELEYIIALQSKQLDMIHDGSSKR